MKNITSIKFQPASSLRLFPSNHNGRNVILIMRALAASLRMGSVEKRLLICCDSAQNERAMEFDQSSQSNASSGYEIADIMH